MERFLAINDINVKGKRVLLRVDLNSSVIKGKVLESARFKEHAKTISELKKKKAKVIVLAHQSRPKEKNFIDLRQHTKILNKYVKINFVKGIINKRAIKKINSLKNGEALLLDNVRFLKEEFNLSKNNKLIKALASLSDIYVQDALSVCHRKNASVLGFPKVLPSYAGPVLVRELEVLSKIGSPKKPVVYIFGGVKSKDYIVLMKKAMKQKAIILTNGLVKMKGVIVPIDYVDSKHKDIGEKTIKEYSKIIKSARTIFMKGAIGYIEDKKFQRGTKELLKVIGDNRKAFSIIGGGSLSTLIKELRINTNKFSYISLSGGALVKYLAGEKLPGLEVLKKERKR